MKKFNSLFILMAVAFSTHSATTDTTDGYKEGMNFGGSIKPNLGDIHNFDTSKFIEGGINPNPDETKYYQGVGGSFDNTLMADGMKELNNSELKDPLYSSMNNKPNLDLTSDLISDNLIMQNGIVKDSEGNFCYASTQKDNTYSTKSCLQDVVEVGACSVKPVIKWQDDFKEERINKSYKKIIPISGDAKTVKFFIDFGGESQILHGSIKYDRPMYSQAISYGTYGDNGNDYTSVKNVKHKENVTYIFPNETLSFPTAERTSQVIELKIDDYNQWVNGYTFDFNLNEIKIYNSGYLYPSLTGYDWFESFADCGKEYRAGRNGNKLKTYCRTMSADFVLNSRTRFQNPIITWEKQCDFPLNTENKQLNRNTQSSNDYKLVSNECLTGELEQIHIDDLGEPHVIKLPCGEYKEVYKKPVDNNQCAIIDSDKSCTQETKVCEIYDENNLCTQYRINYSCGTGKSVSGYQCGSLFYKDCETSDCGNSQSNADFGDVISKLNTIKEAANDINEAPFNIKIFTGKGLQCRKTAVGYNNCCADSGWGQSIGIAGCDNEERELGAAKERGLAISVGEYCSDEVLGVCLQKKRSYCVFDSKLSKIVQQQGRQQQLKIGFGSAKSPDCRGLTLDEFENVNFDNINFSEFYGELNEKIDVPTEQALQNKVKDMQ